jgi:hypothetical protein
VIATTGRRAYRVIMHASACRCTRFEGEATERVGRQNVSAAHSCRAARRPRFDPRNSCNATARTTPIAALRAASTCGDRCVRLRRDGVRARVAGCGPAARARGLRSTGRDRLGAVGGHRSHRHARRAQHRASLLAAPLLSTGMAFLGAGPGDDAMPSPSLRCRVVEEPVAQRAMARRRTATNAMIATPRPSTRLDSADAAGSGATTPPPAPPPIESTVDAPSGS